MGGRWREVKLWRAYWDSWHEWMWGYFWPFLLIQLAITSVWWLQFVASDRPFHLFTALGFSAFTALCIFVPPLWDFVG